MRTALPFGRKSACSKLQSAPLQVKAVNDDGTFEGYGSVFNVLDSAEEIVAPGAFTETLAALATKARAVPVLWQHDTRAPIGVYDSLVEDETGLYVKGRLLKDDVAQAREAYALLKSGAVSGLSIGYWVRQSTTDEKTWVRTLTKLDLQEVSLVTFPANDEARVEAVKHRRARLFEDLSASVAGFSLPTLQL